jgi:FkbM family methyltransferase
MNQQKYYSQYGQDQYLDQKLFKGKEKGVFLDIGAYDGVEYSNTCFFERNRNWTGICIEPNPVVFPKLLENRNCVCKNVCISSTAGTVTYLRVHGYAAMLSGILEFYDEAHLKRIDSEIAEYGGGKETIQLQSIPLNDLLQQEKIAYVDYCNIDVEGGELNILKSVDLNKIYIKAFTIENNYSDKQVENYLKQFGYVLYDKIYSDDVYLKLNFREQIMFRIKKMLQKGKRFLNRFSF